MNSIQHIGAALTGIAAVATASVTIYNTFQAPVQQTGPSAILIRTGIIYDKDGWTNLRQLPSTNSSILTKLANDTEVSIIGDSGNWFHVQTKNNISGFIYKENILEK